MLLKGKSHETDETRRGAKAHRPPPHYRRGGAIRQPGPIRNGNPQPGLRSFAAFLVELRDGLAAARSLPRPPRPEAAPEIARCLLEDPMSPQTAQAFLDGLPRMQAALRDSRHVLGPVA